MSKYSYEFKIKVVQEYLSGAGGRHFLSKKYGIPSKSTIHKWVAAYNKYGADGLVRSRKNKNYSFEFKLHVVEWYLTTEVSYQELALMVGMNNPSLINKWVNDYRIAGLDALNPKPKGRPPKMKKSNHITSHSVKKNSTDSEYLKQLEEENLKLRIENAYLKELRRLRLEGTPQNKKQEISTASEDHLD